MNIFMYSRESLFRECTLARVSSSRNRSESLSSEKEKMRYSDTGDCVARIRLVIKHLSVTHMKVRNSNHNLGNHSD